MPSIVIDPPPPGLAAPTPTAGNGKDLCLRQDPNDRFKVCWKRNGHEGDCTSFLMTEGGPLQKHRWPGPLSPEALYELRSDVVRRFVNYLHGREMAIINAEGSGDIDFTELFETFLKGETK